MPIDTGLESMLEIMESIGMMGLSSGTPEQARATYRSVTCDIRPADSLIKVGTVTDGEVPGTAGPLTIRIYRPESPSTPPTSDSIPTVLFLHGGGWVIGDIDTHENQARRICSEVGAVVVSVNYRLAPEAPFPAGLDDAWATLRWVVDNVGELGGDPDRIAVAGDSAGGNLAAVLALRARDAGEPALAAQLLIYPAVDFSQDPTLYPSRLENAEGKLLTATDMIWFAAQYLGIDSQYPVEHVGAGSAVIDLAHPDLSPIRASSLKGLAPAIVVTAEFDPLRDEGDAYARALEEAGTPVTLARMDGMIHGFFDLGPVSPAVEAAAVHTCALLRDALYP